MKILIIEDKADSQFGGAEKSMWDYITHIKSYDHEIFLAYQRDGDWLTHVNSQLFKAIKRVNLSSPSIQGLISFLCNIIILHLFLKKNKIQTIFTHRIDIFPVVKILKKLNKFTFIVFFKWVYNGSNIGKYNAWGLSCITTAIASTQYVRDYWQKIGVRPKEMFVIIPNGIRKTNKVNKHTPNQLRKMCFFGRIYEGKGLHIVLPLISKYKFLQLNVYGYFDIRRNHEHLAYHSKLTENIESLGIKDRVIFHGNVADPVEKLIENHICVVPSIWPEAQSRVVLECMATQTLVIASCVGGIPEVLGAQSNALTFNPTSEGLIEAFEKVMNWPENRRNEIRLYLFDRFNNAYNVDRTHENLDKILFGIDS